MKQAFDLQGKLNTDYNRKAVEIFRKMDTDKDMKVSQDEFVCACIEDNEIRSLFEGSVGKGLFVK